ncbi:MAG TPA: ribosome maturation factor RimM [Polyangia bacterium]|jgi:16S rRNA processing protein RimM|nr:ribosome maturation factor RimM [Polyangia bacterium]
MVVADAAYDPDTLSVGVLGRPHGIRGDIYFRPHNPRSRAFDDVRRLLIVREGQRRFYDVTSMRPVADAYVAHLDGVEDREAAAALTLAEVRIARAALPPLGPGEFFVEDVVGCAVENEDGSALGVVRGTLWNGAHDVATVESDDGAERMIPLVPDFVLNVDAPGRKMKVRWQDEDEGEGEGHPDDV